MKDVNEELIIPELNQHYRLKRTTLETVKIISVNEKDLNTCKVEYLKYPQLGICSLEIKYLIPKKLNNLQILEDFLELEIQRINLNMLTKLRKL